MKRIEAQFMRPGEIVGERKRTSLIFLPVAPLEWHGPHLPLGVDPLRAELAARLLADALGGVVLPALYMGTERERSAEMLENIGFKKNDYVVGMDFPANELPSLYFHEEVFAATMRNYLELVVDAWKFKKVVIVNGHGAENHLNVLNRLIREFTATRRVKIVLVMPMLNYPDHGWAHAAREETETLLPYHPDSVDLEALPPRSVPLRNVDWAIVDDPTFRGRPAGRFTVRPEEDPRDSQPAKGRKDFEKTIAQLVKRIRKEFI